MKRPYTKQPIIVTEQIDILENKGMEFFDRPAAARILSVIGYYRFSGYAYPFRNCSDNSSFSEGTSFEKIYSIYEFDRRLKSILFSHIARIEIALRTLIIDRFSVGKCSAVWYKDNSYFSDPEEHEGFITGLQSDLYESKEESIQHFYSNYTDEFPPAWIALQIVSFGTIIKVFRNFNDQELKSQVAKHFGCDSVERFISWMNTLVYLRNICGHHARLWNRSIKKRPEAYNFGLKTKRWTQDDVSKLYYSVCIIGFLLKNIIPDNSLKKELAALFTSNSYVDSTKSKFLGFPKEWMTEFIW